jgi:RimJ/RimL family protein N-acetyltransferase
MSNNGADPMWTHTPTLEARGVALRPLRSEDAAAILDASADGELWTLFYTAAPGPHSLDAWMARAAQEHDAGRSLPFAVLRDGKIVGSTRMMRMNPRHRRLEIGTTFYAASVQRTYVNTQAKRLLLEYAFERLDCLSVQFRTDWFNQASRRAIERLGAKQDGVLRNHTVMEDGRVRDTVCYSIIANEWPGVRQHLDFLLRAAGPKDEDREPDRPNTI